MVHYLAAARGTCPSNPSSTPLPLDFSLCLVPGTATYDGLDEKSCLNRTASEAMRSVLDVPVNANLAPDSDRGPSYFYQLKMLLHNPAGHCVSVHLQRMKKATREKLPSWTPSAEDAT